MSRRDEILKVASHKLRNYGYNGFSYADIAKEVGITTASLHYHFRTKEDLAIALCILIQERWQDTLGKINEDKNLSALMKLEQFISINLKTLQAQEICPVVALINNYESLSEPLKDAVSRFALFEYQLFSGLIEEAVEKKEIDSLLDKHLCTSQIISIVKGALIYRRIDSLPSDNFKNIHKQTQQLIALWKGEDV